MPFYILRKNLILYLFHTTKKEALIFNEIKISFMLFYLDDTFFRTVGLKLVVKSIVKFLVFPKG